MESTLEIRQLSDMAIDMELSRFSCFAFSRKGLSRANTAAAGTSVDGTGFVHAKAAAFVSGFLKMLEMWRYLLARCTAILLPGDASQYVYICDLPVRASFNATAGQPTPADASRVDVATTQATESRVDSSTSQQAPLTTDSMQSGSAQQPQVTGNCLGLPCCIDHDVF